MEEQTKASSPPAGRPDGEVMAGRECCWKDEETEGGGRDDDDEDEDDEDKDEEEK
jgi:hypothetical protein